MKKILILFFLCASFSVQGMALVARLVLKGTFVTGRVVIRQAHPVLKRVQKNVQPYMKKAIVSAKENPKQAVYVAGGALLGFKTSGDGIIDTVTGTALGAVAGFHFAGAHLARIAALENLACAHAAETVAVSARLDCAYAELQSLRMTSQRTVAGLQQEISVLKEHAKQQGASPLAQLRDAGKKITESCSQAINNVRGGLLIHYAQMV